VTDHADDLDHGDPLSAPFWQAAREHRLVLQHCPGCGAWQFYPRPFCIACSADGLAWRDASGLGTVHSQTVVHMQVLPHLPPPYVVAVVELDEGPRLTSLVTGAEGRIGDRVRVEWQERADGPPLPTFARLS